MESPAAPGNTPLPSLTSLSSFFPAHPIVLDELVAPGWPVSDLFLLFAQGPTARSWVKDQKDLIKLLARDAPAGATLTTPGKSISPSSRERYRVSRIHLVLNCEFATSADTRKPEKKITIPKLETQEKGIYYYHF